MAYKVLIVEDDREIAELLESHLTKYGYEVVGCESFSDIVGEFKRADPQAVLMDISLPFYDGYYWCGKLREITLCPILMVSARSADADQVYAMLNGADDYITKPFSCDVLTMKLKSQLRRVYGEYAAKSDRELVCGDCVYSGNKLLLCRGDKAVELSKTEGIIVRLIFTQYPDVMSRSALLNEIWESENFVEENTLNVVISRIRKRLKSIGSNMTIRSVRGYGYRLENPSEEIRKTS